MDWLCLLKIHMLKSSVWLDFRVRLNEVIRLEHWSSRTKVLTKLALSLPCRDTVRSRPSANQEQSPYRNQISQHLNVRLPSLPNSEEISFCCLSHPVYMSLWHSEQTQTSHSFKGKRGNKMGIRELQFRQGRPWGDVRHSALCCEEHKKLRSPCPEYLIF